MSTTTPPTPKELREQTSLLGDMKDTYEKIIAETEAGAKPQRKPRLLRALGRRAK